MSHVCSCQACNRLLISASSHRSSSTLKRCELCSIKCAPQTRSRDVGMVVQAPLEFRSQSCALLLPTLAAHEAYHGDDNVHILAPRQEATHRELLKRAAVLSLIELTICPLSPLVYSTLTEPSLTKCLLSLCTFSCQLQHAAAGTSNIRVNRPKFKPHTIN